MDPGALSQFDTRIVSRTTPLSILTVICAAFAADIPRRVAKRILATATIVKVNQVRSIYRNERG